MTYGDVIAIAALVVSATVTLYLYFYTPVISYKIESYVFTGKLFGEPKYGKDAVAQIVHFHSRSSKTLTDVVLKSKSVGSIIDSDVADNGFIGKSDLKLSDDPENAEWHARIAMMPPRAKVSFSVLSNGLMRSHVLTGGSSSAVLMHEYEFSYRRRRRAWGFLLLAVLIGAIWIGIKWLT